MEQNKIGSWSDIGYKSPGTGSNDQTTNFSYSDNATGTWTAESRGALNDCPKGSKWTVVTTYTESTGNLAVAAGASSVSKCITPLTPQFCALSTNGECSTGGAAN